jgi:hypothetical protein
MPRLPLEPRGAPGSAVSTRPPRPTAAVSRCAAATSAATRCCEAAGWRSARRRRRDASVWRAGRPAGHAQAAGGAPARSRRPFPCQRISSQAHRVRAFQRPSQRVLSLRLRRSASLQLQASSPPFPAACKPPPPQLPRACAPAAGARGKDSNVAPTVTPAASVATPPATSAPCTRRVLCSTHASRSALHWPPPRLHAARRCLRLSSTCALFSRLHIPSPTPSRHSCTASGRPAPGLAHSPAPPTPPITGWHRPPASAASHAGLPLCTRRPRSSQALAPPAARPPAAFMRCAASPPAQPRSVPRR